MDDNGRALARVRIFFLTLAVALGALHAWDARHAVNPDGISYLDMGEAYLRADWGMAINGLWSPLYACLLGLALLVARPSAYWEIPIVHLVNFLVYLWALCCFDVLLRELMRWQRARPSTNGEDVREGLPRWALAALLYAVFLRASLSLNGLAAVTPDMCAAAFVYLSSAIVLRIRRTPASRRLFVALGATLGLCYLSKASMLPFAVVLLGSAAACAGHRRAAAPRLLVATAAFLLVGGLYFVPLSAAKGRLTLGDSARLNYAWYVNQTRLHVHWQGEPEGSGTPSHPTRKLLDDPAVYEFRTPFRATYPPWYDPSYWYEGARLRFDLAAQARVLRANAKTLYELLFDRTHALWCAVFLALYLWSWRGGASIGEAVASSWTLLVPPIVMLSLLALVHVEARYTGAFFVLLWSGVVSAWRLPRRAAARKVASVASVLLCALMLASLLPASYGAARAAWVDWRQGEEAARREQWEVCEALRGLGLREGDAVASVGYAFDALWARLARVRIVAEVTSGSLEAPTGDAERFWATEAGVRQ
ncbi:MAG TPA: hypothetical protein VF754_04100, partial [Pyrinomonadaceae bacterium]